jgi:uncharacterized cupredoxin-like copper-binding protein
MSEKVDAEVRDRSRWPGLVVVALVVVACSGTTVETTEPASTSTANPTSAPVPSAVGLAATTEPADAPPAGSTRVSLTSFKFDPNSPTVKTGTVAFFLENMDPNTGFKHNLNIGSQLGVPLARSAILSPGEAAVFTVEQLPPGTYVFWCSVHDHADNGMVGSLTVST